jgi:hypothetical protein
MELSLLNANQQCDQTRLSAFLNSLGTSVIVNGRQYTRDSNFLVSWPVGNVPSSVEFEYARTSKGEYFAELYALAISAPEFLNNQLPSEQIEWLKQNVFNTDANYNRLIAPFENLSIHADISVVVRYQGLLNIARKLFTEQQLQRISQQLQLLLQQMSLVTTGETIA